MPWQNPKTDWQAADGVLNTDLIRIEENIRILGQSADLYGLCTGVANTYSLVTVPAVSSLYDGLRVMFKINVTNTGASTIDVSSTGAKSILNQDGAATPADYLVAGAWYEGVYNGTSFLAQRVVAPSATDVIKGLVELATVAEAIAGTDTTRAITAAGLKATRPSGGSGTIPTTGWVTDTGAYKYKLDYAIADVAAIDLVVVEIANASLANASLYGLTSVTEYAGGITLRAQMVPSVALPFEYTIIKR